MYNKLITNNLQTFLALKPRIKSTIIIVSLFFGFYLPFAIPLNQYFGNLTTNIIFGMVLSFIFLFISLRYYSYTCRIEYVEKRTMFLSYFLICFLIWMIYFIAFFPGCMSSDSIDQWNQANTLNISDWHPAFHTLMIWLTSRIYESPASYVIVQIIFCSLVFSSGMSLLEKLNCERKFLVVLTILFSIFPINGFMVITIWKDVPYSFSILWLTIILLQIFISDGLWFKKNKNKIQLIVVLVMIFFIRRNGILPYAGISIILFIFYFKYLKSIVLVLIVSIILILFIKYPLYNSLHVHPVSDVALFIPPVHQIGSVLSSGESISEDDEKTLSRLGALDKWKNGYSKYAVDNYFGPKYNLVLAGVSNNKNDFLITYLNIVFSHPDIVIEHLLNVGSFIWRITSPSDYFSSSIITVIVDNNYEISQLNPLPFLTDWLKETYDFLSKPALSWLTCRLAIYLYFIIFISIFLLLFNGKKIIIIFFPIILNSLIIFLTSPSCDYRYLYSILLVFFIFLGLSLRKKESW